MIAPKDFVALAIWLFVVPMIATLKRRGKFDLGWTDVVFISLVILVILELLWLRIGYPAP